MSQARAAKAIRGLWNCKDLVSVRAAAPRRRRTPHAAVAALPLPCDLFSPPRQAPAGRCKPPVCASNPLPPPPPVFRSSSSWQRASPGTILVPLTSGRPLTFMSPRPPSNAAQYPPPPTLSPSAVAGRLHLSPAAPRCRRPPLLVASHRLMSPAAALFGRMLPTLHAAPPSCMLPCPVAGCLPPPLAAFPPISLLAVDVNGEPVAEGRRGREGREGDEEVQLMDEPLAPSRGGRGGGMGVVVTPSSCRQLLASRHAAASCAPPARTVNLLTLTQLFFPLGLPPVFALPAPDASLFSTTPRALSNIIVIALMFSRCAFCKSRMGGGGGKYESVVGR